MRYRVNSTDISHDRLQDEVIIINVRSGSYYSALGTAADLWSLISQGASIADTAQQLASAYSIDQKLIREEIEECVDMLLGWDIITAAEGEAPEGSSVLPDAVRTTWAAPSFEEYTDMWELIKLDPIHEVDEVGWPIAKSK